MWQEIIKFVLNIPKLLSPFATWLFNPLPYIDMNPITIFSIGGFTVLITLHIIHLVNVVTG